MAEVPPLLELAARCSEIEALPEPAAEVVAMLMSESRWSAALEVLSVYLEPERLIDG
jgi:hypothetical protein